MTDDLTPQERQGIEESIRKKYVKVVVSPEGQFRYPTGRAGLEALHYDPDLIRLLPESVTASYSGVGNPFSLEPIHPRDTVLDIGCGAGVDTIFAAVITGPSGNVTGIDLVPEMLERAKEYARLSALNINFLQGMVDDLLFGDNGLPPKT